ncbi:hypothetical protein [Streptomyces sp. bgisy029]|uniref:hypothetical protein n=1 Tax=Streptomyces sp. bgisy029 TaxID=3413771 RepID=UPI003D71C094
MPYFAVDDKAHSHTKMRRANNAAIGLWTLIGSWVAQQLTDGHVPGEIAKMYGTTPQMRRLVSAGLWHEHGHTCPRCPAVRPGDFYMHDYRESGNPSRAEVEARRNKDAEKKRRQRSGYSTPPPPPGQMPFDEEPPPGDEDAPPEETPRPPRRTAPAMAAIPADWEPSRNDVHAANTARTDSGRAPLNADQVDILTRKFVRRMTEERRTAAEWGGRWRQWAETERPDQPPTGGVVVHLPAGRAAGAPVSTADKRAGEAFALAARLRAEGNA